MRSKFYGAYLCVLFFVITLVKGGTWNPWGEWSNCSVTCGNGIRSRERTCNDGVCLGPTEMHEACVAPPCGSDTTVWSTWGEWSECSHTCGGGFHTRTRTCSTGIASDCCEHADPNSCGREYKQSRECINDDCYGEWSDWRPWEACNVTCGEGTQERRRQCEPSGTVCIGPYYQTRLCFTNCPSTASNLLDPCSEVSCANDGMCVVTSEGPKCACAGDSRGPTCESHCLYGQDTGSCEGLHGMFYDCSNCGRFVLCNLGRTFSMPCVEGYIWTDIGCQPPADTDVLCQFTQP